MQKLKKLFSLAGALLALAFVSCGSDSDDGSEATEQQKTAGSISYATTTVSKTTDDEPFTNELTKTGDGTVTYASSDEAVAQVDEKKGEVTIKGAGEATITAKVEDSDTYTYATKTASYTLTVTTAIPEGFVKVAGTTIAGTETWTPTSNVLVSGRSLTIPDLYVCDHEVTQAEYEAYCKYGSDSPSDTYGKGDSYPESAFYNVGTFEDAVKKAEAENE